MLVEAVLKGRITPGKSLNKLKDNPEIITVLTDYIIEVEKLLELPIRIITVQPGDITRSHDLRRTHGLFVNDSINLACAQRLGLGDIVTRDADFQRVPTLRLSEPTDI
jgi:predicted nucleic acid-binding protein